MGRESYEAVAAPADLEVAGAAAGSREAWWRRTLRSPLPWALVSVLPLAAVARIAIGPRLGGAATQSDASPKDLAASYSTTLTKKGLEGLPDLWQPEVIHLSMHEEFTMSMVPLKYKMPMPYQVGGEETIMDIVVSGVAYMFCNGTFSDKERCDDTTDPARVLAKATFPGATVVLQTDSALRVRFQNLVQCTSASEFDAGGYPAFGGWCDTNIHFHGAFTGGGVWADSDNRTLLMDMVTMRVSYNQYVDYKIVYPSTKTLGPEAPGSRHQIIHPHWDPMTTLQMGGGALSNLIIDETVIVNAILAGLAGGEIPPVKGLSNDDPNRVNRNPTETGFTIERIMAVSKIDLAQLKKIGQISGGCSPNATITHAGKSFDPLSFTKSVTSASGETAIQDLQCGWYNWACHDAEQGDHSCGDATPKYSEDRPHPDVFESLAGGVEFPYVVTLNGFARVTKTTVKAGRWELWRFANMGWSTGTLNLRFECAHMAESEGVVPTRGNVSCSDSPTGKCEVRCAETCHMRLWSKDGMSLRDPFRQIPRVPLPASGRASVLVMCESDPGFQLETGEVRGQMYLYARDFTQHFYTDFMLYAWRAPLSRIEVVEHAASGASQGWNAWPEGAARTQKKLEILGPPPPYSGKLEDRNVSDDCNLPYSYLGGNVYATKERDTPLWSQAEWDKHAFLRERVCVDPSLSVPAHPVIVKSPNLAPSIKRMVDRFNAQATSECYRFNALQYMHHAACGEVVDDILYMISAHPHHMHLHSYMLHEFFDEFFVEVEMDSPAVIEWIEKSAGQPNGVNDYRDIGQKEYYHKGDFHDTFLPHGVPGARLRHLIDCENLSPNGVMTSVINHCHILSHEDSGMMYQLGVTPAGTGCGWNVHTFDGDWRNFSQEMTGSPDPDHEWKAAIERIHNAQAKDLRL